MPTDLTELMIEYEAATKAHADAEIEESTARRNKTAALNRLNDAQKAIDEYISAEKSKAAWDSRWREKSRNNSTEAFDAE